MDLIERYAHEVGSHLPAKQRGDIEAEIKSTVRDMLEEKQRAAGQPVDEAMTLQALRELGNPEKVAASYKAAAYLIGPELYPIFWKALKIVLAVVSFVALVVLAIRIAAGDVTSWEQFADSIGSYFNWLMLAVAYVVVTFAVMERVAPALKALAMSQGKAWDPAELLKKPDTDRIPPATPVLGIVFTLAALVVFNIYPQVIMAGYVKDGVWVTLASLSDAFFRLMPFINVLWVMTIGFHVVCLFQRQWRPALRWAHIMLQIFGIGIAAALLAGPDVVRVNLDILDTINTSGMPSQNLADMLNWIVRGSLSIAIAASLVEIGKTAYKLFTRR